MAFSLMIRTLLLCLASLTLFATSSSAAQCYSNHLLSGNHIGPGEALIDGGYSLIMQKDCDLVLYELTTLVWSTGTKNKGSGCYLSLETHGNLVIYDSKNRAVWETHTNGALAYYILILQKDRNLALFGGLLWATSTHKDTSNGFIIAGADNGTMVISGGEKNKVRELGKNMEVTRDE